MHGRSSIFCSRWPPWRSASWSVIDAGTTADHPGRDGRNGRDRDQFLPAQLFAGPSGLRLLATADLPDKDPPDDERRDHDEDQDFGHGICPPICWVKVLTASRLPVDWCPLPAKVKGTRSGQRVVF